MANTSCSFPSINDLLAQAEAGQVNITTVVSTCQGICSMAWGAGNPDLSGIGLIVCYVFQAVLKILFGPLFCIFYGQFREKFTKDTNEKLGELHDTFLDTIAQFSVPVAVATVIRFHQNPPFYEINFMHSLTTMQFLSLLSTAVTAGIFDKRKNPIRIIVICIYGLFDFGFYMGLVGGLRTSTAKWEAMNELGEACKAYGTLLPGFEAIKKLRPLVPHIKKGQVWDMSSALSQFRSLLIIFGFLLAAIVCLCIVVVVMAILWGIFEGKIIGMIGLMSFGLSIGMLVELVRMEEARTFMQDITGSNFADNEWGFGQVVSLFLWVPACAEAIYILCRKFSRLMSLEIRIAFDLLSRTGVH